MDPTRPELCESIDTLLAGAEDRYVLIASDGKSGAVLEHVTIDGQPYVVKHVRPAEDWLSRLADDDDLFTWQLWHSDVIGRLPDSIDTTVVRMARCTVDGEVVLSTLMTDVGPYLIPEGDAPVSAEDQAGILGSFADLHTTFWEQRVDVVLLDLAKRIGIFAPASLARLGDGPDVPEVGALARRGWERLAERSPRLAATVDAVHGDSGPLVSALRATPNTLLHGDSKFGNLGRRPDGRTIMVDWAVPGIGPPCLELGWYLAINRMRLPGTKEDAIATYRTALEARGIDTEPWWERQLALSLLGIAAMIVWEKALGDEAELAWWEQAAELGRRVLED